MAQNGVAAPLKRAIGRWDLTAILLNTVIGAGILGLPARTFEVLGVFSVAAWALCALAMGLVALCFAEVGSRFRTTGGPYIYTHAAFGPTAGFVVGWLTWVSRLFSFAAVTNLAVSYAAALYSPLGQPLPRAAFVGAVTAVLTLALLAGVSRSKFVNHVFTACKLLVLCGFLILALPAIKGEYFAAGPVPELADWRSAILLMTFAFVGIESSLITTGEMRDPRKVVPFGLGVGVSVLAVMYIVIQVACIGVLSDLAASDRPVIEATEQLIGPAGATIMIAGALITVVGTLFAILLTASRLPYAFAEQLQLPAPLAWVDGRLQAPYVAILLTACLAWAITMGSSFFGAVAITALTRLLGYATSCAAVVILRRRTPSASAGYEIPGGIAISCFATGFCIWLLIGMSAGEFMAILVIASVGLVLHWGYILAQRRKNPGV